MGRATIRIRYKITVTRRVRIQTRVRYSVRVLTTARQVVAYARVRDDIFSDGVQDQMVARARALLPPGTDDGEIRNAIDAVCEEVDEDE